MSHFNFIFFTKGFHLFVDKFSTVVCKNFFGKSIGEAVALENLKCLVDGFIFQGCSINVLCVMIRNVHCPLMLSATVALAVSKVIKSISTRAKNFRRLKRFIYQICSTYNGLLFPVYDT